MNGITNEKALLLSEIKEAKLIKKGEVQARPG